MSSPAELSELPRESSSISTPRPPSSGFPELAKYELLEEIGHGGMATVYRARDPRLGREVAVKVIHKHLRENAEVGLRFIAEARAAAKLRHPNIVEVFDVSTEDDRERYLVAELIRGCTLRKVLVEHREMPAEVGAAITLELCEAVEHAHEASLVHRDIKPENVLVELPSDRSAVPDRESPSAKRKGSADAGVIIKLTDFGIAKLLDVQGVTSTGQVLGSPAHMAPEQIEGGDVDARTDVFGLGVLMYECLVGHLPFEGKNPAQVLRKVLEGHYAAPDRDRPTVGGRWSRIIAGALARDAADRTASPAELGEQIKAELLALGIGDPHAEINAYFADPAAYSAAHAGRLVPRLVDRGDAARKARDVPGAAADFNRALALAPSDLSILKRIGALTSSAGRRRLARRVAVIAAGSVVLGLITFGVARTLKARRLAAEAAALAGTLPSAEPAAGPGMTSIPALSSLVPAPPGSGTLAQGPAASAGVMVRQPLKNSGSAPVGPVPPTGSARRNVRFVISPSSAKLTVDGQPVNWFSAAFVPLSTGSHAVSVFMESSKCCKPLKSSISVDAPPDGDPEQVQRIPLPPLELLPARLSVFGAPEGARYVCSGISQSGPVKSPLLLKLRDPEWPGTCRFSSSPERPGKAIQLTLRAGESTEISWPGD
jgi:serine/threonine-protein kinase